MPVRWGTATQCVATALLVLAWPLARPLAQTPAQPKFAATASLQGTVHIWEAGSRGETATVQDRSGAVIFLAGFEERPTARRLLELAQQDKEFTQRVLAITQGETVAFPNKDPFHHNVWSKSKARPFDLGLYKFPESKEVTFPTPGILSVFCNIHPHMIATILVLPNTRYALTPADGSYRIEGIPAGTHTVFAWVEGAAPMRQILRFEGGKALRADFRLQLKRIPLDHLDKDGRPYNRHAPVYNAD